MAVVGDGKLGLLVAQVLVLQRHSVTHFGKHEHKLRLVSGTQQELVTDQTAERHAAVSALRPCTIGSRVAQPPSSDSIREMLALALRFVVKCISVLRATHTHTIMPSLLMSV